MIESISVGLVLSAIVAVAQKALDDGPLKSLGGLFRRWAVGFESRNPDRVNWYLLLGVCMRCWGSWVAIIVCGILAIFEGATAWECAVTFAAAQYGLEYFE